MPLLTNSRMKCDRARKHVEAAEECVEGWLGTDAYTIVREKDPETGYTVARAKIKRSPPPKLSLLIGDAIQNFRTALDHAVYALAESHLGTIPSDREELLMFPIVGNVNREGKPSDGATIFAGVTQGRRDYLFGVPDDARTFIEQEQPYHWDDGFRYHPLWLVHDLNRIDKHRRVALTTAWLDLQYVSHPTGVDPKVTFFMAEGPVADDDVLVIYSGAEEGVGSNFERGVAINEPSSPDIASVQRTLAAIQQRVEWVIASLERWA